MQTRPKFSSNPKPIKPNKAQLHDPLVFQPLGGQIANGIPSPMIFWWHEEMGGDNHHNEIENGEKDDFHKITFWLVLSCEDSQLLAYFP